MRLCDVTPPVIAEQRDQLGQIYKGSTINQYLAVLSHVFTTAEREWQWTDSNPMQRVNRPGGPKLRIRFLSDDERRRLLDACKASKHPYLHLIVVLALSTGARRTEILTLRWDDVDPGRRTITLHDTKNKQRRTLPVTGLALDLMRQHARVRRLDTDLVFPRADGLTPTNIEQSWRVARRQAQIDDFRFHDLRHSAASYLHRSARRPNSHRLYWDYAAIMAHGQSIRQDGKWVNSSCA